MVQENSSSSIRWKQILQEEADLMHRSCKKKQISCQICSFEADIGSGSKSHARFASSLPDLLLVSPIGGALDYSFILEFPSFFFMVGSHSMSSATINIIFLQKLNNPNPNPNNNAYLAAQL
jgi:hypothetical protein